MLRPALLLPFFCLATPALADEIACEGAFAIDSSAQRLVEVYGADNVVSGEVPGPEGTTMIATTVFPDDPDRRMEFVWWDEAGLKDLSYVELPQGDVSPGGLRPGLTVAEVEALNGEPFTMTGFWWDYGGYAGFQSGNLADIPGGCILSVRFFPGDAYAPDLDVMAVSGDVLVESSEPLLEVMDVRVRSVAVGYPHPDFRDEPEPEATGG